MRDRIDLGELLRQQHVDLSALEPAPAKPTSSEKVRRIQRMPPWPCSVCGEMSPTVRVYDSPEHGPRWVDLCRDHGITTMPPWRGPSTVEGIIADLREVADKLGLTLRLVRPEKFEEKGRRARKRRGRS
ncbi:hypothetical protein OG870_22680 [Streptomyces sp. NBC_00461]|uniref:hypothetical protein n=1 Tax=Streptomyces sp. NBC_00461 TaxID=2975750 RepID=UPI002E19524D